MPSVLCPQRQAGWRLDILGGRCCRRGCCGPHTPKLSPIAWTCPAVALPHSLDQTNVPPGLTGDAPGVGRFSLPPFCCLWSSSLLPYQPHTGPSLALVSQRPVDTSHHQKWPLAHSPQPPHSGTSSSLRVADPLQPMRPSKAMALFSWESFLLICFSLLRPAMNDNEKAT